MARTKATVQSIRHTRAHDSSPNPSCRICSQKCPTGISSDFSVAPVHPTEQPAQTPLSPTPTRSSVMPSSDFDFDPRLSTPATSDDEQKPDESTLKASRASFEDPNHFTFWPGITDSDDEACCSDHSKQNSATRSIITHYNDAYTQPSNLNLSSNTVPAHEISLPNSDSSPSTIPSLPAKPNLTDDLKTLSTLTVHPSVSRNDPLVTRSRRRSRVLPPRFRRNRDLRQYTHLPPRSSPTRGDDATALNCDKLTALRLPTAVLFRHLLLAHLTIPLALSSLLMSPPFLLVRLQPKLQYLP